MTVGFGCDSGVIQHGENKMFEGSEILLSVSPALSPPLLADQCARSRRQSSRMTMLPLLLGKTVLPYIQWLPCEGMRNLRRGRTLFKDHCAKIASDTVLHANGTVLTLLMSAHDARVLDRTAVEENIWCVASTCGCATAPTDDVARSSRVGKRRQVP